MTVSDPALELLERHRHEYSAAPRARRCARCYAGAHRDALIEEARRRGLPVHSCPAMLELARRSLRYRAALLRLRRRELRRGNRDLAEELRREALRAVAVMALAAMACGQDNIPERLRGELVDALFRIDHYFSPCYERAWGRPSFDNCIESRAELALEGSRRPDIILSLLRA